MAFIQKNFTVLTKLLHYIINASAAVSLCVLLASVMTITSLDALSSPVVAQTDSSSNDDDELPEGSGCGWLAPLCSAFNDIMEAITDAVLGEEPNIDDNEGPDPENDGPAESNDDSQRLPWQMRWGQALGDFFSSLGSAIAGFFGFGPDDAGPNPLDDKRQQDQQEHDDRAEESDDLEVTENNDTLGELSGEFTDEQGDVHVSEKDADGNLTYWDTYHEDGSKTARLYDGDRIEVTTFSPDGEITSVTITTADGTTTQRLTLDDVCRGGNKVVVIRDWIVPGNHVVFYLGSDGETVCEYYTCGEQPALCRT